MKFDISCLQPKEQASFALRALYEAAGCRKYHMGRFEEYGLYQENRSFLSSEQVITFTDLDGRLLALKPDVTLSIAKTAQPAPGETLRYYYHENVYRPSAESHTFKEIGQMGLEMLGDVGEGQVRQAVSLAAQSLEQLGQPWVLEVSHMGYLFGLLDALDVPEASRAALLAKLKAKNLHELKAAASAAGMDEAGADALAGLMSLCGSCEDVLPRVEAACRNERMEAAAAELKAITEELAGAGGSIRLDMTLAGEMEYYNGLVFQGYLESLPRPVLKGGRYDLLMQKFTPGAGAIGFAVYLDELDRLSASLPTVQQQKTEKTMLNVALPKGRLGDKVYDLLAGVGYGCPEDYNATRKLVVENPAAGIRYFLVKPSDVAIYVEHGAADVGIVGKDILTEASADVYELLDTGLGKCRMCVAAPADHKDDPSRPVRVATKFVNIAKSYYASIGRDIDIIKLNGSIELAPILGLSDVIVDIVETGTTLRENGLRVVTEFMPISARFIANKASYQFKHREMDEMLEKLREAAANIEAFHRQQVHKNFVVNDKPGIVLGQKYTPIEKAGVYVPGGTAAYPSTVLMDVIPAKVAGVSEIVMTTPAGKDGKIDPVILAAAATAGVTRIFKTGGAQAVAALAYGTQSIPVVDKIVGPGNIYVATAKRKVFGKVGIDMIAGPSEILVLADGGCDPAWVTADLLSQAEHDRLASPVLVTDSAALAKAVQAELEVQIPQLPRAAIARASVDDNGKIIVCSDLRKAIEACNIIAPEHLEVCVDDPFSVLNEIKNAGSIFLGRNVPEALGDYFAGPNHTLPTSGTARFSSPLGVDDFVKKSSFIYYTREALEKAAPRIADFAEREGLHAHARSVTIRYE